MAVAPFAHSHTQNLPHPHPTHTHRHSSLSTLATDSSSASASASASPSPFTEVNSLERYQHDSWAFTSTPSCSLSADQDDDIALHLSELKRLLEALGPLVPATAAARKRCRWWRPGSKDPELLTLKADRLISNDVLELIRPDARLLYVGKAAGYHSRTLEEIHELLLSFMDVGANVVRLKGGDPLESWMSIYRLAG